VDDLAAFQATFVEALSDDARNGVLATQPGFAVYLNTSTKACLDALRDNYPTVWRLLGEDDFATLATAYLRFNPPSSPVLATYGEDLPSFLARPDILEELPYLPDVAQLDRLGIEAHFATDVVPVDPAMIAALDQDALMRMPIALHPATRYQWFETPAFTIWQAHRDNADLMELEVDWEGEGVLLTRSDVGVTTDKIDRSMLALLEALARNATVGAAAIAALSEYPEADLTTNFAHLLERNALTVHHQIERVPHD